MQLYDYQESAMPGLEGILRDPGKRLCLLNASTGFGKTYMALELMRRTSSSFLVLCPKVTLSQWRSSADACGVKPRVIINPEKIRTGRRKDILEKLSDTSWNWTCIAPGDVVILDEVHRYGAPDSQLAYMAASVAKQGGRILGLSATLADSPLKMRLLLHQSRLVPWLGFYNWAKDVGCYRDPNINGHPWRPPFGAAGRKVMADLNTKFFPDFGVRLRSEDVPNFPEVQNIVDLVTPSEEARRNITAAYDSMADELKNPDRAKTELTQLLRWRQRVEAEKLHVFRELVEDGLEDGYSVVASFNFTDPMFEFSRMLAAHKPALVYGSDPQGREQKDRDAQVARFQRGETRLLCLMIQAGGVGLDLGDVDGDKPRLAYHNLPLNTVDLVQLLGRIHRANSRSKSVNRIVCVDGVPIEKKVFSILRRKIGNLNALQADGDTLNLDKLIQNN